MIFFLETNKSSTDNRRIQYIHIYFFSIIYICIYISILYKLIRVFFEISSRLRTRQALFSPSLNSYPRIPTCKSFKRFCQQVRIRIRSIKTHESIKMDVKSFLRFIEKKKWVFRSFWHFIISLTVDEYQVERASWRNQMKRMRKKID